MYAVLAFVAQANGNPNWTIQSGNQLLAFGNGRQVNLGPLLTSPGENLTITISAATPNAQVNGTFAGNQYVTIDEAAQHYMPMANAITVNQFSAPLLEDRIDTAAGSGSKLYPMPPGAQTVMVTIDLGNGSRTINPTQLIAKCFPSDFAPIQAGAAVLNVNPRQLGLLNPIDTAFDVEWTMAGANAANCFLDVTVLAANLLNPQNVAFQFDANQNLNVSMASAQPAAWQAANLTNAIGIGGVVAGSTTVIVAGSAGLNTRLYRVRMGVVAAAGSSITIECPTGQVRAQIDSSRTQDFDGDFGKVSCGINASLVYVVHGANASVSGGFGSVNQS